MGLGFILFVAKIVQSEILMILVCDVDNVNVFLFVCFFIKRQSEMKNRWNGVCLIDWKTLVRCYSGEDGGVSLDCWAQFSGISLLMGWWRGTCV